MPVTPNIIHTAKQTTKAHVVTKSTTRLRAFDTRPGATAHDPRSSARARPAQGRAVTLPDLSASLGFGQDALASVKESACASRRVHFDFPLPLLGSRVLGNVMVTTACSAAILS
jgi:hypothetical protein